jgi:hypothetical protein
MAEYVIGWQSFIAAGERLRNAEVEKDLRQAARDAMGGLSAKVRRSAIDRLPKRGRLNEVVARDTDFSFVTTGDGARLTARSSHDIEALDAGHTVHPLFGDKRHWYPEEVKPGWWSEPLKEAEPDARAQFEQAMETIKQRIEGG